MIPFDDLPELVHVRVGEIANPLVQLDPTLLQDVASRRATDAVNVGQADLNLLVAREIDAGDTSHAQPCRCLCLGLRLQMMRVTPCRFTTLQCSQIGFTLLRTFTGAPVKNLERDSKNKWGREFLQVCAWCEVRGASGCGRGVGSAFR